MTFEKFPTIFSGNIPIFFQITLWNFSVIIHFGKFLKTNSKNVSRNFHGIILAGVIYLFFRSYSWKIFWEYFYTRGICNSILRIYSFYVFFSTRHSSLLNYYSSKFIVVLIFFILEKFTEARFINFSDKIKKKETKLNSEMFKKNHFWL